MGYQTMPVFPGEHSRAKWIATACGRLNNYDVPKDLWLSICQSHMPPEARPIEPDELVPLSVYIAQQRNKERHEQVSTSHSMRRLGDDPHSPAKTAKLQSGPTVTRHDKGAPRVTRDPCIDFRKFSCDALNALVAAGVVYKRDRMLACFEGEAREWVFRHLPDARTLKFAELFAALKKIPSAPRPGVAAPKAAPEAARPARRQAERVAERRTLTPIHPALGLPRTDPYSDFKLYVNQKARKIRELDLQQPVKLLLGCFAGEALEWIYECIPHCRRLPISTLLKQLKNIPSKPRGST